MLLSLLLICISRVKTTSLSRKNIIRRRNGLGGTFRVKLLMHIRMILLEPILALLRCAAELAILGLAHQPVVLSWASRAERGFPGEESTSGGREQTVTTVRQRRMVAKGKGIGGGTAAVDDVSGLGLRRRCICMGCFDHCVRGG